MKNAIIIGAWLPTIESAEILNLIIKSANEGIPNADIYCGINPSLYAKDWIKGHPKIKAKIVEDSLVINSDTSAYQAGLQLYCNENTMDYDNVWFFHTKGAKSEDYAWLHRLINTLPKDYDRVNSILWSSTEIGSMGDLLIQHGTFFEEKFPAVWEERILPSKRACPTESAFVLDEYFDLPNKPFEYFYGGTWYVVKAEMLSILNEKFLYSKLDKHIDGGLYFMERDFIHVVDRQGYIKAFNGFRSLADFSKFGGPKSQEEYYDLYKEEFMEWAKTESLALSPYIIK